MTCEIGMFHHDLPTSQASQSGASSENRYDGLATLPRSCPFLKSDLCDVSISMTAPMGPQFPLLRHVFERVRWENSWRPKKNRFGGCADLSRDALSAQLLDSEP